MVYIIVLHCLPSCYVTFSEEAFLCILAKNLKNYSDRAGKDWTSCPTATSLFSFVIYTANRCRDAWRLTVLLEKGFVHVPQKINRDKHCAALLGVHWVLPLFALRLFVLLMCVSQLFSYYIAKIRMVRSESF